MTRRLALHCCSTSASPGRRRALPWDQGGLPQPSRNRQRCDASSKEDTEEAGNHLPSVDLCLSRSGARPRRLAPWDAHSSSGWLHFCPLQTRLLHASAHSGVALLEVNSKAAVWSPIHRRCQSPDPSTGYWEAARGTGPTSLFKACTPPSALVSLSRGVSLKREAPSYAHELAKPSLHNQPGKCPIGRSKTPWEASPRQGRNRARPRPTAGTQRARAGAPRGRKKPLREVQGWLAKARAPPEPAAHGGGASPLSRSSHAPAWPWQTPEGSVPGCHLPKEQPGRSEDTVYLAGHTGCCPTKGSEVQHVHLCTSVPLSLPSHGAMVPSHHLGVQLGVARPRWQGLLSHFPMGEGRRWGSGPPRCAPPLP